MSEQSGYWERLQEKGLEGQFLWELEHGYELSPRQSQGILETVNRMWISLVHLGRNSITFPGVPMVPRYWGTLDG